MVTVSGQKLKYNLLAIGIDERVFDQGSEMHQKALEYGQDFVSSFIICRSFKPRLEEKIGSIYFYPIMARPFFLFFWQAYRLGKKIMQEHKGSWLISSDNPFELGFISWLLARGGRGFLHLHIHTDFMSPYFRRASWKEFIRVLIARFVVLRADCIRVVSERIKKSLLGLGVGTEKITVLPIFTDVLEFMRTEANTAMEERLGQGVFKILTVGRFVEKEKNFGMVIRAFEKLRNKIPGSILVIIGEGPDERQYRKLIIKYNLENSCIIEGWKENLASVYKVFDLFLMPSNFEGWGRAVIEAMASGLPVVMTDVGLAGEVVKNGETGIVVPVGDKEKLLQAVVDLYKNPERRKKLAQAGQDTIKDLEPKTKEEYLKLYKKSFESCLPKMKLLIITQKVDSDDENLGFFHRWIEEFSKHVSEVGVITGTVGSYKFPSAVRVYSLGKEQGAGRLKRLGNFWKLFYYQYLRSDAVFFHMIPEYVLAAAPFLIFSKKPKALWYVHKSVTPYLKIAERLIDYVFTASDLSFRLPSKKVVYTGHAIDTEFFKPTTYNLQPTTLRLLTIGRISPVKDIETIIRACAILKNTWDRQWTLSMVGGPLMPRDNEYLVSLKNLVKELGLEAYIHFQGSRPFTEIPQIYQEHDIFISMSTTGSIDKSVLEAMSTSLSVITANEAFQSLLPQKYFLERRSSEFLAERIKMLADENRPNLMLRKLVEENHSLSKTIKSIINVYLKFQNRA